MMLKSDNDLEAEFRWWQDAALELYKHGCVLVFVADSDFGRLARAANNLADGMTEPTYSVTFETVEGPVETRPSSHYEKLRDQVRKQKLIKDNDILRKRLVEYRDRILMAGRLDKLFEGQSDDFLQGYFAGLKSAVEVVHDDEDADAPRVNLTNRSRFK